MRKTIGIITDGKFIKSDLKTLVINNVLLNCWRRHHFILDDTYTSHAIMRVITQFDDYHPVLIGRNKHPRAAIHRKFYLQVDDPHTTITGLADVVWAIGVPVPKTTKTIWDLSLPDPCKLIKAAKSTRSADMRRDAIHPILRPKSRINAESGTNWTKSWDN